MMQWLSNRLQEFDWGYSIVGKFFYIINLTILFKVFDVAIMFYIVIPIVIIFGIWMVGLFFNKNLRENYMQKRFKGVIK